MRRAKVSVCGKDAGLLSERVFGKEYVFEYNDRYSGLPVSLTMPVSQKSYSFDYFPPFFDGLLPEGHQLEGLLKQGKVDRNDYFSQLMLVGNDTVGAVSVKEVEL
ncbi:MAG: toxin HipA [Bacteroidetes bacterium HGW-Bacteroidetes-21]|jgi:serine/threonine-protein kinase HipA|nr:MAG: toxin HipA [Bacteroidetes bacterium HGW-Bacteroidetes-21]